MWNPSHYPLIFSSNLISFHVTLCQQITWVCIITCCDSVYVHSCVRWISVTLGKCLWDVIECTLWLLDSGLPLCPASLLFPRNLVIITEKETVLDTKKKNAQNKFILFIVMSTFCLLGGCKWSVFITIWTGENILKSNLYIVLQTQRLKFEISFL